MITASQLDKLTRAVYNIDYPDFEKHFVHAGGTKHMARHFWDKWKVDWKDNFLWAYGNMETKHQKTILKALMTYKRK
jgi:hypothetical protein